nr:WGR domain-containing protein [Cesiribacter sp. SM1]
MLYFREGNSDKVYELELQEVGAGEYVVNFRYGRRGTALREGTKTIFPVSLAEAEKVYEKLLKEKTDKGYQSAGSAGAIHHSTLKGAATGQEQAVKVLEYLRIAAQGRWQDDHWKLSRLVWRAGELRLKEAEPYLLNLPRHKDEFFNYALAWSLGRCAGPLATDKLMELRRSTEPKIARIATVALSKAGTPAAQNALDDELMGRLPSTLREALRNKNASALLEGLNELLYELRSRQPDFLFTIYLLSRKHSFVSPVLQLVLQTLPFRPPYFQQIRYLLKASELLDDTRVWGVINARIDKNQSYFKKSRWGGGALVEGEYIRHIDTELKKDNSRAAYSDKTRKYLQKRALRLFTRMGEAGDSSYTAFARDLLLQFTDADNKGPSQTYTYDYDPQTRRSTLLTIHYPPFWQYPLLNLLLYRNSQRFELPARTLKLRYRATHLPEGSPVAPAGTAQPGAAQPGAAQREEAFPALWDAAPQDLVVLLQANQCQPVNTFAVKAFRANPHAKDYTSPALVLDLLNKVYPESHELGLELARERYDPDNPDVELLFALLNCKLLEAQALGISWLQAARRKLLQEKENVVRLLLAKQPAVGQWTKDNLSPNLFSTTLARGIVEDVLQQLPVLVPPDAEVATANAWVSQVADLLLILFPEVLKEASLMQVQLLLSHPLEAMQALGVKILLRHRTRAEELPAGLFEVLLTSSYASVRALGVNLFGQLTNYILYERREVLVSFCLSVHPEVRQQVMPIVAKLVQYRSEFGRELLLLLLPLFWQKESHEGIHADLLVLFQESLLPYFKEIPEDKVWKLIDARFRAAHLLGTQLLQQHLRLEDVPLERIAALANHELLELRQLARAYFESHVEQARYEREATLKLLDAPWDDTWLFTKQYLETYFKAEDWTPALLVSVCDHKREEVQQWGLRLINRYFQEEDGVEYMLKLSQHPNTRLQLYVTNYLKQYAAGQPRRIEALEYYFTAVLSQVNSGRVAKERVFDFLQQEALASEAVAVIVVPLISRISITIALRDKARCLQLLAEMKKRYPGLDSPVSIKEPKTV